MTSRFRQLLFIIILAAIAASSGIQASTSGTISGYIRDKETGNALPGTSIVVGGTTLGAMADKSGYYIICNVPVGNYSLRATMIGYVPTKVTAVEVKTDLNTQVDFSLTAQVLKVEQEIVITAPRVKIYKDLLSSVHYVGAQELSTSLPAQTFHDALILVPGFVSNHFRGGRTSNALYLIDGLSASGPLTRDLAFMVRNSAIAEMVVQTGGFNPEYGNVSAGLVNIITKEGRNDFQGMARIATDIVGREERRFDNSRRAEFTIGGPLIIGLGGPVVEANYLISGGMYLSDTPYREALRQYFKSPLLRNYDLNGKFSLRPADNIYLRWQTLLTNWHWRQYDARWVDRPSALPERKNRNLRLSLSLTHTLSPLMFYHFDLVGMELRRSVLGDVADFSPPNLTSQSQSVASIWPDATEPWNEHRVERQFSAHLSLLRQFHPLHQIKLGVEADWWDLQFDRTRYLLWPSRPKNTSEFVYSRYVDSYRRFPVTATGYIQDKIELPNFLAHFGVRYQLFAPRGKQSIAAITPEAETALAPREKRSPITHTLAPRLGLAIPVGNIEHLSLNYGWFYELPPLYYLYLNSGGNQEAFWPIFGNVDLKPVRSQAWEVTYRRVVSSRIVFSVTGFHREYHNLIDTAPYLTNQHAPDGRAITILRYENNAEASMNGFEVVYKRDFSKGLSGSLVYTYLRTIGTGSWPESSFLSFARGEDEIPKKKNPLAWDQRNTMALNLGYVSKSGFSVNLLSQMNSPAKATNWLTGEQQQLPWRHFLDAKISFPLRWAGLPLEPFLEIRNLLDEQFANPGEGGLDFSEPTFQSEDQFGRRIWIGVVYR
jgi:outer membrane receptor protein involved in Fe transport